MIRRAEEIFRTEGVFSLWCKILALIGYRRVLLVEQSLDAPIAPVTARVPVTIGRLRETEVDEYLAFHPEVEAGDIRHRLQAGDQCFTARYQGTIVHAAWAAPGRARIDFLGRDLDLAPDEVYIDGSRTVPSFRGHNITGARSAETRRYYQEAGYRRSLAVVFPENGPACRAVERQGYRPVATIGYVKLGPWRFDFRPEHPSGKAWAGSRRPDQSKRARSRYRSQ
jgi:hypothetical protein